MRLTSSLHTSLLASFLLALGGCAGSVDVTSPAPGASAAPAPTAPPTKPVSTPPTKAIACGLGDSKDPTRVVLAWVRGAELVFTRADGSSFVAHEFPAVASDDPGAAPTVQLDARGDFVAAIAVSYTSNAMASEAVLIDRSGKVRWSEASDSEAFNALYLGEGGALAVGAGASPGRTIVVGPEGKIGGSADNAPISAPTKSGRVAVQHNFSVYAAPTYGWLDPVSGEIGSFAYSTGQSYPVAVEGGVAYLTPDAAQPGGSIFVTEGDSVTGFELPSDTTTLGASARHGFLVIQDGWGVSGSQSWRAQPGSQPAPLTLPDLTVFGAMYYEGVRAGDLGEVLAPLRDEHRGGLYRSVDLGATWSLLGPSFADITDVRYVQRAGTYVIQATDEPGYFPMAPWEPPVSGGPAPDRSGPANELIRPADGIARALPDTAAGFALSEEGGCLAYQDGGHLFAGTVAGETAVDLGETYAMWGSPVVWLR